MSTIKNLADAIERFIVEQLLAESKDMVMVQRNELAEQLACAPSQISYVLSTRFTPERGYVVESRRGSGGFVRIERVPMALGALELLPREFTAQELVENMAQRRKITPREEALLSYMLSILNADEQKKKEILQQAIGRMQQTRR